MPFDLAVINHYPIRCNEAVELQPYIRAGGTILAESCEVTASSPLFDGDDLSATDKKKHTRKQKPSGAEKVK